MSRPAAPSVARVLALCLDSADPGLVRRLAGAGEMPATAALLARGAVVDTAGADGVYVSSNWPSLFTADEPDRHGYLCWLGIEPGTYEPRPADPTWVRSPPIWRRLSQAGRRVAVLDMPNSQVEDIDGVVVCEWGSHDRNGWTAAAPPAVLDELTARHGRPYDGVDLPPHDIFAPCDYAHRAGERRTAAETEALVGTLRASLARKGAASLDLLSRGGWDLFVSVIAEPHCVGHQLWHLHDPAHEHHDADLVARLGGDPVADVYRRLDAVIGDHVAALGPEDAVYLVMPHGMAALHSGAHILDHVLDRLEFSLDHPAGHGTATRLAGVLTRPLPRALRRRALRRGARLLRDRTSRAAPSPVPAPAARRFFQAPNNTVWGAVRLNLAGREPSGRVAPAERGATVRWLADRLGELVNLETGGPVIRRCVLADEAFRRREGDGFADLYVEWERGAPIERVWSPAAGTVNVAPASWRQGDHAGEGMTVAAGPGIAPGHRPGVVSTADVGATLAAAAGTPLEGVDGRAVASILPAPRA